MRLVLALLLLLVARPAAADVMPSPGRPDFPDTPQPEPAPIPLEVVVALLAVGGAVVVVSRRGELA